MNRHFKFACICFLACALLSGQDRDLNPEGVDSRVNYNQLFRESTAAGIPWDDRNLQLFK